MGRECWLDTWNGRILVTGYTVAISCAFEENAIRAISQYMDDEQRLIVRLVPSHAFAKKSAALVSTLPIPKNLRQLAARKLVAASRQGLRPDAHVSNLSEPLRMVGSRVRTPLSRVVGNYLWKAVFDMAASRVDLGNPDVIIGMPGACLRTFRRNSDKFLIFHAVDSHPQFRNSSIGLVFGGRGRAEAYPPGLVRRIEQELELAHLVLVPSALVREQMVSAGVAQAKLVTVPYGVSTSTFNVSNDPRVGAVRPRVIFVGQISLRKGIPILLEAARGLNIDVVLAGAVFDPKALSNMPENVQLLGVLTPDQLADEYRQSSALVLPTLDDAFGLVVTEATSAGLPVITTDACGASEGLTHPRHQIIPAGDVAALRTALARVHLIRDDERCEIAGQTSSRDWTTYSRLVDDAVGCRIEASRYGA